MKYYLVDYENVGKDGLNGIDGLSKRDTVCIFYSENADSLTFDLHRKLNESKASILFQKVEVGTKNALDFQLATYLGYLISSEKKQQEYCIVSRDNGFGILCAYWKKKKIEVYLAPDLLSPGMGESHELADKVAALIPDKEISETVVEYIRQYKTKQEVYTALARKYPSKNSKQASEIYHLIKPLLPQDQEKSNRK